MRALEVQHVVQYLQYVPKQSLGQHLLFVSYSSYEVGVPILWELPRLSVVPLFEINLVLHQALTLQFFFFDLGRNGVSFTRPRIRIMKFIVLTSISKNHWVQGINLFFSFPV